MEIYSIRSGDAVTWMVATSHPPLRDGNRIVAQCTSRESAFAALRLLDHDTWLWWMRRAR